AAGGFVLGKLIDDGHGVRAVVIALGAMLGLAIARVLSNYEPGAAVAVTAAGALIGLLYTPTLMTAIYNLAKRSPCAMRFTFVQEGGWDVGHGLGCAAAAALCALGVDLLWVSLLSILGIVPLGVMLPHHYPSAPDLPHAPSR